jgi:hypothetical protein
MEDLIEVAAQDLDGSQGLHRLIALGVDFLKAARAEKEGRSCRDWGARSQRWVSARVNENGWRGSEGAGIVSRKSRGVDGVWHSSHMVVPLQMAHQNIPGSQHQGWHEKPKRRPRHGRGKKQVWFCCFNVGRKLKIALAAARLDGPFLRPNPAENVSVQRV